MSVASHYEAKEMILTHGECERLSIVLVFCWSGWYARGKKRRPSELEKVGGYLTVSAPPLSEIPMRNSR